MRWTRSPGAASVLELQALRSAQAPSPTRTIDCLRSVGHTFNSSVVRTGSYRTPLPFFCLSYLANSLAAAESSPISQRAAGYERDTVQHVLAQVRRPSN